MPRRKQQAPKRAAAYSPEETSEQTAEGRDVVKDEEPDTKHRPQTDGSCPSMAPLPLGPENDRDTCLTDLSSSRDVDSESVLSEQSDRVSDVDSVKNEEVASRGSSRKVRPGTEDSVASISPGSLEQMKAIYNSFLTSSHWPSLGLGVRSLSSDNLPCTNKSTSNATSSSSSSSSNSGSTSAFDWHQSAMAKTLQQMPPNVLPLVVDPGLLSTIHLQRQSNNKLYGSIFTGASKFRCKGCSLAYETLVELTVHMNETGHYRDDNHAKDGSGAKRWSKPRKRSLLEMEGKEDAQKVLRCMYCGHSFESLQDLSVHMIKTKHYQKVPLKEPMPSMAAKMVSQSRKKLPVELDLLIPQSKERTLKETSSSTRNHKEKLPDTGDITNNHHGSQNNGSTGIWQFESHKSQILKCMECGSSHDSLQELTAHMLVTGHFINVSNIAMSKKPEVMMLSGPTSPSEEKAQSVPLPPSSLSSSPLSLSSPCMSPTAVGTQIKQEDSDSKHTKPLSSEDQKAERSSSKYDYLTEEDLKESPKGARTF
ncbi:hypothetical protein ACEWY4_011104 [Coilia grayii]|uniref:C2H2-type domain-containing protein n=1 Tax=Coilia grayii TaxID=363190 RepID=A0ABD1K3S8_9TELE